MDVFKGKVYSKNSGIYFLNELLIFFVTLHAIIAEDYTVFVS